MNWPSGLICGSCTARIPNRSSTVIGRGSGACRAATTELAEPTRHSKTARRTFMRVNPPGKNEYECGTGQSSTAKMNLWAPASLPRRRLVGVTRWIRRRRKISRCDAFFPCARVQSLYSSKGGLAWPYSRASFTLGGREKKIEHSIAPRSDSLPGNPINKKGSSKTDALAACCRYVLYGVRGHLWNRSHYLRRRLRTWHSRPAFPSDSLVPADSVHDR